MKILLLLVIGISILLSPNSGNAATRATLRFGPIEKTGTVLQYAIPISALVFATAIGDYAGDVMFIKAYLGTQITTEVLKRVINEERPFQPEGSGGKSFPSGHTSVSFFGAAIWQRRFGWKIGIIMFVLAAFVGYSRLWAHAHNLADVLAGSIIGIGFAYYFVRSKYTKKFPIQNHKIEYS